MSMLGLVKHIGGTAHRYVRSCAFSLALKQIPSYILRCCTAVFHAAYGKDVMFSLLNMWLIFKCTFTYALGQGDAKDQIVCASSIKNSMRLHARSCYIYQKLNEIVLQKIKYLSQQGLTDEESCCNGQQY